MQQYKKLPINIYYISNYNYTIRKSQKINIKNNA